MQYDKKIIVATYNSILVNLLIGISKLFLGVYYFSYWFLFLALYYILLGLAKGWLLHKLARCRLRKCTLVRLQEIYHRSGILIGFLGISFFLCCLWLYSLDEMTIYPYYILYGVVAIGFYKIASSIRGLLIVCKHRNPIFSAIKSICFLDAWVSMANIQCMLLIMQKSEYAFSSSSLFGIAISVLFMAVGIFMVCRKFDC